MTPPGKSRTTHCSVPGCHPLAFSSHCTELLENLKTPVHNHLHILETEARHNIFQDSAYLKLGLILYCCYKVSVRSAWNYSAVSSKEKEITTCSKHWMQHCSSQIIHITYSFCLSALISSSVDSAGICKGCLCCMWELVGQKHGLLFQGFQQCWNKRKFECILIWK